MDSFQEHWENAEGRIPGCLPRVSKPGEICPLASERITIVPRAEWEDRIADSNYTGLWPSVPVTLDQDGVGSCATESTAGAVMTCRSFNGQDFELLNPWFIYHTTSGGRDSGSNIDTNLEFARDYGIAPESVWPRSKGWRASPSSEAVEAAKSFKILEFFDIQSDEEFGSAMLAGMPVVYGRRGHSIYGIDLVSRNTFRMENSWGDWGDNGTAVESISGINYGYGLFAVRLTTDTSDFTVKRVSELPPMFEPYPTFQE